MQQCTTLQPQPYRNIEMKQCTTLQAQRYRTSFNGPWSSSSSQYNGILSAGEESMLSSASTLPNHRDLVNEISDRKLTSPANAKFFARAGQKMTSSVKMSSSRSRPATQPISVGDYSSLANGNAAIAVTCRDVTKSSKSNNVAGRVNGGTMDDQLRTNFERTLRNHSSICSLPEWFLRKPLGQLQQQPRQIEVLLRVCGSSNDVTNTSSQSLLSVDPLRRQVTINHALSSVTCPQSTNQRARSSSEPPHVFSFDRIFLPTDSMADICAESLSSILTAVVSGSDGCIFSFGHSKLGKTYTMLGSDGHPLTLGVIPSAIAWLFRLIDEERERTGARFNVRVSAVEITGRNETLRDLLAENNPGQPQVNSYQQRGNIGQSEVKPGQSQITGSQPEVKQRQVNSIQQCVNVGQTNAGQPVVDRGQGEVRQGQVGVDSGQVGGVYLRDDPIGGTHLENQCELRATSGESAAHLLDLALASRSVTETAEEAKNSHLLFTLHVYQYRVETTNRHGQNGLVTGGRSRLHLFDLGSCGRTKDSGTALSLTALSTVITALLSGQRQLPFRESKLTRLLKESLGGARCHATMIAHVSDSAQSHTETLQVTQMAARVRRLRISGQKPKISCGTSSEESSGSVSSTAPPRPRRRTGVRMGTGRGWNRIGSRTHSDPECTSSSEQSTVIFLGNTMSDHDVTDSDAASSVILAASRLRTPTTTTLNAADSTGESHIGGDNPNAHPSLSTSRRIITLASRAPRLFASGRRSSEATIPEEEELWIDGPLSESNTLTDSTKSKSVANNECWIDGPSECFTRNHAGYSGTHSELRTKQWEYAKQDVKYAKVIRSQNKVNVQKYTSMSWNGDGGGKKPTFLHSGYSSMQTGVESNCDNQAMVQSDSFDTEIVSDKCIDKLEDAALKKDFTSGIDSKLDSIHDSFCVKESQGQICCAAVTNSIDIDSNVSQTLAILSQNSKQAESLSINNNQSDCLITMDYKTNSDTDKPSIDTWVSDDLPKYSDSQWYELILDKELETRSSGSMQDLFVGSDEDDCCTAPVWSSCSTSIGKTVSTLPLNLGSQKTSAISPASSTRLKLSLKMPQQIIQNSNVQNADNNCTLCPLSMQRCGMQNGLRRSNGEYRSMSVPSSPLRSDKAVKIAADLISSLPPHSCSTPKTRTLKQSGRSSDSALLKTASLMKQNGHFSDMALLKTTDDACCDVDRTLTSDKNDRIRSVNAKSSRIPTKKFWKLSSGEDSGVKSKKYSSSKSSALEMKVKGGGEYSVSESCKEREGGSGSLSLSITRTNMKSECNTDPNNTLTNPPYSDKIGFANVTKSSPLQLSTKTSALGSSVGGKEHEGIKAVLLSPYHKITCPRPPTRLSSSGRGSTSTTSNDAISSSTVTTPSERDASSGYESVLRGRGGGGGMRDGDSAWEVTEASSSSTQDSISECSIDIGMGQSKELRVKTKGGFRWMPSLLYNRSRVQPSRSSLPSPSISLQASSPSLPISSPCPSSSSQSRLPRTKLLLDLRRRSDSRSDSLHSTAVKISTIPVIDGCYNESRTGKEERGEETERRKKMAEEVAQLLSRRAELIGEISALKTLLTVDRRSCHHFDVPLTPPVTVPMTFTADVSRSYIATLESEIAELERHLRAYKSRVMLVTCFDSAGCPLAVI